MLRSSPVHANPALPGTPASLHMRYITEDVPYGLVGWASMGRQWSVPTPTIDALIQLASVIERVDYRQHGVTAKSMGIEGLTPAAVRSLVD
jgi:opine dehydrogenase